MRQRRLPLSVAAACVLAFSFAASCGGSKTGSAGADGGGTRASDAGAHDGGSPDAAVDAGTPFDAGDPDSFDAGAVTEPADAGVSESVPDAGACPDPAPFNYQCTFGDTSTCPQGLCLGNLCIAPIVNAHRWDSCANGTCDTCETPASCPADCAPAPTFTGQKVYDDPNTITVWVHGFSNVGKDKLATLTYGSVSGCGGLDGLANAFGEHRPCGDVAGNETAPNQLVGVEYYGAQPPSWMSSADINEVENYPYSGGPEGLQRYGLIVAKFIRWRMGLTGATHVNIGCHSMGCLITRYVIENDIEHLASENHIVRWVTSAGVVAGARLARMYDNPTIQQGAEALNLEVSDFILMNPDYVEDHAAAWDHKLYEGNNPLFQGILIHHVGATNPQIPQALNIQLLDTNNPGDEPNDGIMFTKDEYFAKQRPQASVTTPSGEVMSATRSFVHIGHMEVSTDDGFRATAAAGLFHRRRVIVTLDSLTLKKDHEFHGTNFGEAGTPPADLVMESQVRYDPYTKPAFGKSALVQDDRISYRSAELFNGTQGQTWQPKQVVFEGPVFDAQTQLQLDAKLIETDWYPRFNVRETLPGINTDKVLLQISQLVDLSDQTLHFDNSDVTADLKVHVVAMY